MKTNIYLLGLIITFANMFYLYYIQLVPVLTDATAFFLGFLVLYAYLSKNKWLLATAVFLCSLTWPIAIAVVAPLFIYTHNNSANKISFVAHKKLLTFVVIPLVFLISAAFIYYLISSLTNYSSVYIKEWKTLTNAEFNKARISISISILMVYFALIIYKSKIFPKLHNLLNINYKNLLLYVSIVIFSGIFIFCLEMQSHFYGHAIPILTTKQFLACIFIGAIAHPGAFIVSNLFYYGPVFLLILCFLDDFFETASNESFGMLLLTMITLFLAINPESRQLTFSFPFLIYITCATMAKFEITISKVILFLCISLTIYHPLPTVFFYW